MMVVYGAGQKMWQLTITRIVRARNKIVVWAVLYNVNIRTIGRTSRATFGIPTKRLNITIYPILYHGQMVLELQHQKQF